jgi:hypothetical protein
MSDSFGAAKPGKTGSSSDVTAQRRKLAIAKTYNNQPLNRLFKGASGVITLGSINSTFQTQNNVANIASDTQIVTVSSSVTGMVYGEYRISGTYGGDADIDAILEMISACTGIPVSNLTVTVRAGSIILAWSTITPVPLKIVNPVQTQIAIVKQYMTTSPQVITGGMPGGTVVNNSRPISGYTSVSINNSIPSTTTATTALADEQYAVSATDRTITFRTNTGTVEYLLPGTTAPYHEGIIPPDGVLRNVEPNRTYTFRLKTGTYKDQGLTGAIGGVLPEPNYYTFTVQTASTPTLTQVGQDISVTGLLPAPTSYIYSLDSGLTWYQLTNNTIPATTISEYTIQIMVDPTSQTPNVLYGISTTRLNVTLHSVLQTPVYKPDELSPLKATFEITNNFLFGYTYILTIEDITDYTTSQATTIESQGTYIVDGLAQGHKYTAALVMKDSAGTPRAWSTLVEFLTPPPPPIFILNGNKITITNTDNTPGASYNYSITPGISNTPSTGSIGGGATIELTSYTIIPGTIYSLQIGVRLNSVTTLSLPAYAIGGVVVYDSVTQAFPPAYTAMYPVSVSGVLVGGGQAGPRVQPVPGQSARVWFGGGGGSTLVIPSSKPLMIPASKTLSVALGAGGVGTTPNWTDQTTRNPTALGVYGGITSLTIEDYGIFQAPCINTVPPPANFTQNVVLYPGTITPLNIDGPFGGAQAFDYDPSKFGGGGVRITTDGAQMPGKSGYYSLTLTPFTLLNPTIQATSATSLTITSITVVPGITYTYIIIPSASSGSSGTITSSNTLITGIDPTVSYSILVTGTLGERIVAQSGELKIAATNPQPIDTPKLATPSTPVLTSIAGSPVSLLITNIETSPKTERSFFYALNTAPTTWIPLPNGSTQYTLTGLPYAAKYSVKIQVKEVYQKTDNQGGAPLIFTNYAESASSNIVVPTEIPKPTTPVLSQIAKSYTSLRLTNIDKNSLLSYSYSTDNGVTWKSIPKNAISFTITGLLPSTTYTASVRAKSGGLFSAAAVSNSATTPGISAPSTPTLVQSVPSCATSLVLTNIDNDPKNTYFYNLNLGGFPNWIPIPKGLTTYTITGLGPSNDYSVSIRAKMGSVEGAPSGFSNVIRTPRISTPILSIVPGLYRTLQVTNLDNFFDEYYSLWLHDSGPTYRHYDLPKGITSYTFTSDFIQPGQNYYVVAGGKQGKNGDDRKSPWSNVITSPSPLPIISAPSTPTLSIIAGSYSSMLLSGVDSTQYYRLNTQAAGTYTAISSLIPSGNGYTVQNIIPYKYYSICIVTKVGDIYGPESAFSPLVRTQNLQNPSTPTLSLISGSYNLLLGNVDKTPGYTYYFRLNTFPIGQYNPITDLTPSGSGYILSELEFNKDYTISILANVASIGDGIYGPESTYSNPIKIPIPKPSTPTLYSATGTKLIIANVPPINGLRYGWRLSNLGDYTGTFDGAGPLGYIIDQPSWDVSITATVFLYNNNGTGPMSDRSNTAVVPPRGM